MGVLLLNDYQTIEYGKHEGAAGLKDDIGIVLGRSNYVGSILLLLIPLAVAAVFLYKGKIRLLLAGCSMLMFAGLVTTMSRGAVGSLILATILSLPLFYKAGMRFKHVLLVLGAAGLVVFLLPSDLLSADAALMMYRWDNTDLSRIQLLRASWESFSENPVLGVGPGQLGRAIAAHVMVPDYNQQYMNSHNLIFDALAESGLASGLALLSMVGVVLFRAFRTAATHRTALDVALWCALLAAVIHNMVEASFEGEQFQVIFWTVCGVVDMRHRYFFRC